MNTKMMCKFSMTLICALYSMTVNAETGITTLVSVSSDGMSANDHSDSPSVSADGRFVAFDSAASNLVTGDTNRRRDVFVHDRQTGETTRVNVTSDGAQANGNYPSTPSISADGRFVAFRSNADNLVVEDTNIVSDIFVHDRQTGETTRVSVASDGTQTIDGGSESPSISADGRFVKFESEEGNLVAGDTNVRSDVFVHDRQTGKTTRVSVASDGAQGNEESRAGMISANGRFVVFQSLASNLVVGDTNDLHDIFVHDRQSGETTRVNVASDGTQANGIYPVYLSISADGRFVAFESLADNLVAGDTNSRSDVFIHDRQTGETTRLGVTSDGAQARGFSYSPRLSADGRFVAFKSDVDNLVVGDTNGITDLFLHNRQTGETTRVSVTSDDTQRTNGRLDSFGLSADGRVVAFSSKSDTSLAPGDPINLDKRVVYVHERLVGPLAEPQLARIPINTSVSLTLQGQDPENDPLTFNIVTPPLHGALSGVAPDLVYEPNTDFSGVDRFTFTVTDGMETSAQAAVILQVSSSTSHTTLCSNLGNNPDEIRLDRDLFFFKGTIGEDITIKLEKNPDGVSTGNRVYAVLWQVKNRKLVKPRQAYKQGWMPIELKTTLPETGNYLINVVERRGAPFIGDYCLFLDGSDRSADTLGTTRSVE